MCFCYLPTHQIKHQYDCTVTHLNTEISHLQEELCKSQSASNAANIQVVELRRALEEVRDQLVKQVGYTVFFSPF